jgi:hypothetical protein
MMWAELKLGKVVDWTILKSALGIYIPIQQDIPRGVLKFPSGRLSIKKTQLEKLDPYVLSDSSPHSGFDGSQPLKLSNNPAAVASIKLQMRKRTHNDEQLLFLHIADVQLIPHNLGTSKTAGVSTTVGANSMAGVSDTAGTDGIFVVVALQGASTSPGTRASASANYSLGSSGSAGAIQPIAATYPLIPHDNLRMLEIRSNMDAFGTTPIPPASQMALL